MNKRPNVNSNFSKVLGISANSISLFNSSVGLNLNFYENSLYVDDLTSQVTYCCTGGTPTGSMACESCGANCKYNNKIVMAFYAKSYLNCLLFNVAGTKNWYYSATAFLVETPVASPSTQFNNQIYWYVN